MNDVMSSLNRRLRESVHERARYYVRCRRLERLVRELGLPPSCEVDLETAETLASVKAHLTGQVKTLVDVGAHVGGFSEPASRVLGVEQIVCIEPFSPLHDRLRARLKGRAFRLVGCALGATPGPGGLYAHADPSMNSMLPSDGDVLARDFDTYDHRHTDQVAVAVNTLDGALEGVVLPEPIFLKIDTQGTELNVLRGGTHTLARTSAVLVEHMFTTPYSYATHFADLVHFMGMHEFECAAVVQLRRRHTHRISAVDFLFCRQRVDS